jgi:hypothetical protein
MNDPQAVHDDAERRLARWERFARMLRVGTAALVVVLIAMVGWLGYQLDNAQDSLNRQDCIAHVNGAFFGHLASALGRLPASVNRDQFLDRMKTDAASLVHLDETCPK